MNTIKIKNVEIGKGIPKICIPLTGKNREEIIEEMEIVKKSNPDLIEWRVDFFEESDNPERICEMLGTINDSFKQIPVLFTFRTKEEGGEKSIMSEDYVKLLKEVSERRLADIVDVQVFWYGEKSEDFIKELKETGAVVLASSHHFEGTPSVREMSDALYTMENRGADIVKLVASGDLVPAQLVQIKSAIEKGLTETQLIELITNNISAEKMKEIIEIAVLENSMAD